MKFKVGDKVKYNHPDCPCLDMGKTYKVKEVKARIGSPVYNIIVEGRYKDGSCPITGLPDFDFEKVEEVVEKNTKQLKVTRQQAIRLAKVAFNNGKRYKSSIAKQNFSEDGHQYPVKLDTNFIGFPGVEMQNDRFDSMGDLCEFIGAKPLVTTPEQWGELYELCEKSYFADCKLNGLGGVSKFYGKSFNLHWFYRQEEIGCVVAYIDPKIAMDHGLDPFTGDYEELISLMKECIVTEEKEDLPDGGTYELKQHEFDALKEVLPEDHWINKGYWQDYKHVFADTSGINGFETKQKKIGSYLYPIKSQFKSFKEVVGYLKHLGTDTSKIHVRGYKLTVEDFEYAESVGFRNSDPKTNFGTRSSLLSYGEVKYKTPKHMVGDLSNSHNVKFKFLTQKQLRDHCERVAKERGTYVNPSKKKEKKIEKKPYLFSLKERKELAKIPQSADIPSWFFGIEALGLYKTNSLTGLISLGGIFEENLNHSKDYPLFFSYEEAEAYLKEKFPAKVVENENENIVTDSDMELLNLTKSIGLQVRSGGPYKGKTIFVPNKSVTFRGCSDGTLNIGPANLSLEIGDVVVSGSGESSHDKRMLELSIHNEKIESKDREIKDLKCSKMSQNLTLERYATTVNEISSEFQGLKGRYKELEDRYILEVTDANKQVASLKLQLEDLQNNKPIRSTLASIWKNVNPFGNWS